MSQEVKFLKRTLNNVERGPACLVEVELSIKRGGFFANLNEQYANGPKGLEPRLPHCYVWHSWNWCNACFAARDFRGVGADNRN